jgi:hypothetical protein
VSGPSSAGSSSVKTRSTAARARVPLDGIRRVYVRSVKPGSWWPGILTDSLDALPVSSSTEAQRLRHGVRAHERRNPRGEHGGRVGGRGTRPEVAQQIDASSLSPERRSRFFLDVARAHAQRRHVGEATAALLESEALALEQIHDHHLARKVIRDLIQLSEPRVRESLRGLAERSAVGQPILLPVSLPHQAPVQSRYAGFSGTNSLHILRTGCFPLFHTPLWHNDLSVANSSAATARTPLRFHEQTGSDSIGPKRTRGGYY